MMPKNRGSLALSLALTCVLLATCARNPVTGDRELALISEAQEIEMGQQAAKEIQGTMGLKENDALVKYVQQVGLRLAAGSERPELPWSFGVVEDPTPNAFALPGGFIFITRGMLTYMDSEAELASVLGHEIGHVTARHSVQQLSRAQLAQLGLGLGTILVPELQQFSGLLSSGVQLLFLKYGRDAERQSDELGFGYALSQKYDVREMDDIFATLQQISEKEGGSPLPAWASTHPDPGERIEAAQRRVTELNLSPDQLNLGREDFMARVDGLVWGDNPRNGFFEGNVFMHPDLAFRIAFPQGWKTQNLPQAVVAVSPEKDAALQLTLAPGNPEQAASKFLAQEGLQAGPAARETINGSPAVVARFAGQTQQGVLQGLVGFVAHRDLTYQIVGYTPQQRYEAAEGTFVQALRSFGPLTDQRALGKKPQRIDVVKVSKPTSLEQFAKEQGSTVKLEELALINQVDPRATLPAGTLVKRVIEE
jgi:predicted Zn-dependent protease